MTQVYGCGFINVTDGTVIEALLPEGMVSFEGENNGLDNGCKPKLDYTGRLLFIAADNDPESETYGLPKWLVRATRIPGSPFDSIQLGVGELPTTINEDGDYPVPNQLTVDQNGDVYFPGGATLDDDGNPVIIKAEITGEGEGTITIDYTITAVGAQGYFTGSFCVTLSKDHMYVATYGRGAGGNGGDWLFDFDCLSLTYCDSVGVRYSDEAPYNMETDCAISSPNLGWSYVIVGTHSPTSGNMIAFLMPDISDEGAVIYNECEVYDEVLSVGKLDNETSPGTVYTMERINNAPAANNVYRYIPSGAGVVVYDESFTFNLPMNTPTHLDNRRDAQDEVWASSAISPETDGEVRKNDDGTDATKHERDGYVQIAPATKREQYFPSIPP